MPPDRKGSGALPAEPDQPTQAPPRPATNGSSAVTSPPGLRCQRVLPSGSVTWSTGSRLATTTTGLSARVWFSGLSAIPPATLPTRGRSGTGGQHVPGRGSPHPEHQRGGQVGQGPRHGASLGQPD